MASIKNLDLRQLQPFLDRNWAIDGKMPEEAVQKLQGMVYIRAIFYVYSSSPPQLSLRMPDHFAAVLGTVSRSSSKQTLVERLPQSLEWTVPIESGGLCDKPVWLHPGCSPLPALPHRAPRPPAHTNTHPSHPTKYLKMVYALSQALLQNE